MKKTIFSIICFGSISCCYGWWGEGHQFLTTAAMKELPQTMPAFFREASAQVALASLDADASKNKEIPGLKEVESPEHYFDIEILPATFDYPCSRLEFLRRYFRRPDVPRTMGFLPYTIEEYTERLAFAFAKYRTAPANIAFRDECIRSSGYLAHYAEDACQPLHVTVDYDGRARPGQPSPHTGIHDAIDGIFDRGRVPLEQVVVPDKVIPYRTSTDSVFSGVIKELWKSHGLVDSVYAHERELKKPDSTALTPYARAFAIERGQEAARFTAELLLTSWEWSQAIRFEAWYTREIKK